MTDENKTPGDLDALVAEQAKTAMNLAAGVTPAMIKDAIQRELASRAATEIVKKLLKPSPASVRNVRARGF